MFAYQGYVLVFEECRCCSIIRTDIQYFDEVCFHTYNSFLQQPGSNAFSPVFVLNGYLGQVPGMHVKYTMTYHHSVKESPETHQVRNSSFYRLDTVLPRGAKVTTMLSLSDGVRTDLFNDAVGIYSSDVNLLDRLPETVKFPRYLKVHPAIDGNCFLVVLQDFQQVLFDAGFFEEGDGMGENLSCDALPSVFLYRSCPCVIGGRNTVECSCSVQGKCYYFTVNEGCKR